jgi:hypothetical protein
MQLAARAARKLLEMADDNCQPRREMPQGKMLDEFNQTQRFTHTINEQVLAVASSVSGDASPRCFLGFRSDTDDSLLTTLSRAIDIVDVISVCVDWYLYCKMWS